MRKIAFVTPDLRSGGSERAASRLTYLLGDRCKIYYIVFDDSDISYDINAEFINLNALPSKSKIKKVFNTFKRANGIKNTVKKYDIDTVMSFTSIANRALRFSNAPCRKIGACRGFEHFEQHPDEYKALIDTDAEILFNSKEAADFYIKKYGKTDKISIIENPLDFDRITKLSKDSLAPDEQEFFDTHKVISNMGIFSKHKGHWDLLKSFEILKQSIPDAGLVIIGHRGLLENDIRKIVKNHPYTKDILLTGFQKNPFKYLAKSDVFAFSSISEGFPNALLEAMACGVPCVSTNCKTGPKELLIDGEQPIKITDIFAADNGILVPCFDGVPDFDLSNKNENHKIFADALSMLLNDENLRKKYSEKGIERAKKNDYKIIGDEYKKLLNL